MQSLVEKAEVLVQALPYMRRFMGTVSYTHLTLPTKA